MLELYGCSLWTKISGQIIIPFTRTWTKDLWGGSLTFSYFPIHLSTVSFYWYLLCVLFFLQGKAKQWVISQSSHFLWTLPPPNMGGKTHSSLQLCTGVGTLPTESCRSCSSPKGSVECRRNPKGALLLCCGWVEAVIALLSCPVRQGWEIQASNWSPWRCCSGAIRVTHLHPAYIVFLPHSLLCAAWC